MGHSFSQSFFSENKENPAGNKGIAEDIQLIYCQIHSSQMAKWSQQSSRGREGSERKKYVQLMQQSKVMAKSETF